MKFLSFEEFVNESIKSEFSFYDENNKLLLPADFKKVQFLADTYNVESEYTFKHIACKSLFKPITLANLKELDYDMPILNFAQNSFVQKLIDEKKLDPKKLYNKPKDKEISARKLDFHKLLGNTYFLPKTVFTPEAASKLKFPIIAKPSAGHSGIGITKFSSSSEMKSYPNLKDFDLFSEAIEIEKEVRIVFLKDEIVSLSIRESRDEKSKFLQGKSKSMGKLKAEDKLDFIYHVCLPEEISSKPDFFFSHRERKKELDDIVKEIRKKVNLEYLTVDIAIDKNDKIWVIEINSEPGSIALMLSNTYVAIFKDFYDRDLDEVSKKCLRDVELKLINFTLKSDKFVLSPKFVDKYIK